MKLTRNAGELVLEASVYRLVFLTDRPFVNLETPQGERVAELFIFSSVHPLNGRDDTYATGEWTVSETATITRAVPWPGPGSGSLLSMQRLAV